MNATVASARDPGTRSGTSSFDTKAQPEPRAVYYLCTMRTPGPTLETNRLLLRPPQSEDVAAWTAFAADEETMRHLGGVEPRSAAWRSICTVAGAWTLRGFSMFSVIEKATGRWVGRLGPWMPEGWLGTEVGWGLAREVWGRGYAKIGRASCRERV